MKMCAVPFHQIAFADEGLSLPAQIIALLDIEPPPPSGRFSDCYLVTELMETDLHRVIYSRQKLSPEHVQYFVYQVGAFSRCLTGSW